VKHETTNVNGVDIHYVVEGSGPTILFLHGFPELWYAWKEQLAAFGEDHQAVAPDLRGYNLSGKPAEVAAYTVPNLVGDVKGLLDRLSPGMPAVLVGHDWGGITAWAFAAAFPDRLSHLVIINAPHPVILARELANNPAQRKAMGYTAGLRSPQAEAALQADDYKVLSSALFDGAVRPDIFSEEDRSTYKEAWAQPGALTGLANYYRASALAPDGGTPAAFPTLTVPTLVLWGEKDRALLPGNLDGLDEVVTNLKIERIPDGTHWVVHEEGPRISRAIREFITPAGVG
jgi:pimeloyl-ACP methyl ester carboxylesterase